MLRYCVFVFVSSLEPKIYFHCVCIMIPCRVINCRIFYDETNSFKLLALDLEAFNVYIVLSWSLANILDGVTVLEFEIPWMRYGS